MPFADPRHKYYVHVSRITFDLELHVLLTIVIYSLVFGADLLALRVGRGDIGDVTFLVHGQNIGDGNWTNIIIT